MPWAKTLTVGSVTVVEPPANYSDTEADNVGLTDTVTAQLATANALAPSQLLAPANTLAPKG